MTPIAQSVRKSVAVSSGGNPGSSIADFMQCPFVYRVNMQRELDIRSGSAGEAGSEAFFLGAGEKVTSFQWQSAGMLLSDR
jgi:hypothetical protein